MATESNPLIIEGATLTRGMQHDVWSVHRINKEARLNQLAKIPGRGEYWDEMTHEAAQHDLAVMKEFGVPMPETTLHKNVRLISESSMQVIEPPYAYLQERVPGSFVTVEDIETVDDIREQFRELVKISARIEEKHGAILDIVGFSILATFFKVIFNAEVPWEVGNIIQDQQNRVVLIDARLLDPAKVKPMLRSGIEALNLLQKEACRYVLEHSGDKVVIEHNEDNKKMKRLVELLFAYRTHMKRLGNKF